ncbi:MAG: putative photosynthetic complex assembly protein PuhE [Nannocystaceae bacterium]
MNEHALAIVSVVVVWWLSTGVVLRIVWLPRSTHRISLAIFSVAAVAAMYGLVWASNETSVGAAYLGFGCSLAVWAWHELSFLLGVISGPRKVPARPEASGWQRFRDATATVIHHEIALAATAIAVVGLTWGAPNQVATGTFLVLWIMRLSAKLNVFVGVRNLSEEFIPPHLRYLTSYFRRSSFSPLMFVSVFGASLALLPLASEALTADAGSLAVSGHTIVATMLAMAIIEHVFLALPLPDSVLWSWILDSRASKSSAPEPVRRPAADRLTPKPSGSPM